MTDELSLLYLTVFSVLVVMVIAISVAGYLAGSVIAGATAVIGWAIFALWQTLQGGTTHFPLRSLMLGAIVSTVSLSIVYLPMRYLEGLHWLRARLFVGVLLAAVATIVYPMQMFILRCLMGIDCI